MSSNETSYESSRPLTEHSEMTKTKLARTVSFQPIFPTNNKNGNRLLIIYLGGQIGHRKYDCPEQRNFTASIICRVCGNAGHMAKDCPDRQRGTDWRNGPSVQSGRRGGGDAVDREMEVSFQQPCFLLFFFSSSSSSLSKEKYSNI